MTEPREPIRIDCEGSNAEGHAAGWWGALRSTVICAMCGHQVPAVDRVAVAHQRDDILAMLDRGDFG